MNNETNRITIISNDGLWSLSFDFENITPLEAVTADANKSTVNLTNGELQYIGEDTITLNGKCSNTIFIEGEAVVSLSPTEEINQTLTKNTIVDAQYLPLGFGEYTTGVIIKHTDTGEASFSFVYTATVTNTDGVETAMVMETELQLPKIFVGNLPFTEMDYQTKRAILNGAVAIKTKIIVNSSEIILSEENAVKSWELVDERYVPNNGFIGQFVSRTLSGELHNISDDFNIEDSDIELQLGIVQLGSRYQWLSTEEGMFIVDENGNRLLGKDLGEDMVTWYSLGNFLVTKPEDDEVADNTTFEAMDYAVKFNTDFNANYADGTYTKSFATLLEEGTDVTLQWLASYTCAQAGVVFGNTEFTNSDFVVKSNQLTAGESCRDVMKYISEMAFGWCRIGWDNKCYIDELPTTSTFAIEEDIDVNTLTNDNYYSLTTQRKVYGPVNKVVVALSAVDGNEGMVEDVESISEYGLTQIQILDNPFLFEEGDRQALANLGQQLFGLTYTPLDTETPGHPWLLGNERITVNDMEGNPRETYPFNRTLSYTGHIRSMLTTPTPTKQENKTALNKSLYKSVKDANIKIDRQEGKINQYVSKVDASVDRLSKVEQRVESEITETYSKTEIKEIITGTAADGTAVESVKTTSGTFDKNGLTIEQAGTTNTKTNINSNGMRIYTSTGSVNNPLLTVDSNGVVAKNISVSTYLTIGEHSRIEDYRHTDGTEGTGIFWIGG